VTSFRTKTEADPRAEASVLEDEDVAALGRPVMFKQQRPQADRDVRHVVVNTSLTIGEET